MPFMINSIKLQHAVIIQGYVLLIAKDNNITENNMSQQLVFLQWDAPLLRCILPHLAEHL